MIRRPPRSTLFSLHDALPIYQNSVPRKYQCWFDSEPRINFMDAKDLHQDGWKSRSATTLPCQNLQADSSCSTCSSKAGVVAEQNWVLYGAVTIYLWQQKGWNTLFHLSGLIPEIHDSDFWFEHQWGETVFQTKTQQQRERRPPCEAACGSRETAGSVLLDETGPVRDNIWVWGMECQQLPFSQLSI